MDTNETGMVILDTSTGEIVGKINNGDRIVRNTSVEFLSDTVEWGKGWSFMKVFDIGIDSVCSKLSGGAVLLLMRLTPYIAYGSNLLCNRISGNPLSNDDITNLMGVSKVTLWRIMDELVEHKILFRGKTGRSYQYYANPYIFCRGQRINKTLEAMFKDYKPLKK